MGTLKDLSNKRVELAVKRSGEVFIMNVLHDDQESIFGLNTVNGKLLKFDRDRIEVIEVKELESLKMY